MKNLIKAALTAILVIATVQVTNAQQIATSKHNLSTLTNTTTQICVFCHTPHSSDTIGQLWNKSLTGVTNYTLYSSERLAGYPTPSQPKSRSKLCMSCHDGTIAIGSVYNLPGPGAEGTITMAGSVTTMPTGTSGYIGTDLSDDHPVGFSYDTNSDPELVSRNWPWKTQGLKVLLDPDASNGTVECNTCHNPHDSFYTPFLNEPASTLCTTCHAKTGWGQSVHYNLGCISCHNSHGGGKALLKSVEEINCVTGVMYFLKYHMAKANQPIINTGSVGVSKIPSICCGDNILMNKINDKPTTAGNTQLRIINPVNLLPGISLEVKILITPG